LVSVELPGYRFRTYGGIQRLLNPEQILIWVLHFTDYPSTGIFEGSTKETKVLIRCFRTSVGSEYLPQKTQKEIVSELGILGALGAWNHLIVIVF